MIKVISRGGNYLLNIGPRGDGSVVEFERDVLLEMGKWIKANSEAIYGITANPFDHTFNWGEVTTKNGNLYLFVKKDFYGKDIGISGFKGSIASVKVLETNELCDFYPPKNMVMIGIYAFRKQRLNYLILYLKFLLKMVLRFCLKLLQILC